MKFSQHPSFLATLLALSSVHAMAASPKKQPLRIRKLQENADDSSDDFWGSVGKWTGGITDSITENFQDLFTDTDGDICNITQGLIGMGESFMGEANCECSGDLDKGLELNCEFDACSGFDVDICGRVGLGFTLGGPDFKNRVGVSTCTDFYDEDWETDFEQFCMSFSFNAALYQSLDAEFEATYGDQSCMPSIKDDLCVSVDCSRLLPGLDFDTCQFLSVADAEDMNSWFPNFEIFDPDFELEAEIVPWTDLDLDHVDFQNFDMGDVQWGDSFLQANETWVDLIGPNPTFLDETQSLSEGVCTMMFQAANLYEEQLGWESSCECDYDEAKGALELDCDFSEVDCTDKDSLQPCNSVDVTLTYARLETINANVCIRYEQFPEICYSYDIPFAAVIGGSTTTITPDEILPLAPPTDLVTPPALFSDCSAQYALPSNTCQCTIDENNCMTVDCTDFEPLAVTDNCQVIDLRGIPEDPSKVVLNFKQPDEGETTSDGEGGEFVASIQESSAAPMTSRGGAVAMATGLLAAGLFL